MNRAFAVWASSGATAGRDGQRLAIQPEGWAPEGREWTPVSPYLPLGFAEGVAAWLGRERRRSRLLSWSPGGGEGRLRRSSRRLIAGRFAELGPVGRLRWPSHAEGASRSAGAGEAFFEVASAAESVRSRLWGGGKELEEAVLAAAGGRCYTDGELARAVEEEGLAPGPLPSFRAHLDKLVARGLLVRTAGVGWSPEGAAASPSGGAGSDGWRCRRCGSQAIGRYPCYRCGLSACPQCDTCASLGRMTACTELYTPAASASSGPAAPRRVQLRLAFALTPQQERIAQALAKEEGDALVWAACGAGKTEVTYEAIRRVVAAGGRALFAVPRRDVVEQLGARLGAVFAGVEVAALFGGTPQRYTRAPVVVATVHQTLRFYRAFELAVVDEVDAYPLNREPWLLDGLERALAPGGRMIAMSATPSPAALRRAERGGWPVHVLPARHHGHPLPVPQIVTAPAMRGAGRPDSNGRWEDALWPLLAPSVRRRRRVLLFVPAVSLAEAVAQRLIDSAAGGMGKGVRIASVHARDSRRSEKVGALVRGELDILVSTTVLERGVTLPFLDVVVFAADAEWVWDAASLVQMAGRVGRSAADPQGSVYFLAARTTPAMREAILCIERLNRMARERGLLVEGPGES